jgi:hypothetical protein
MGFFEGAAGIVTIVAIFIVLPSMIISAQRKNSRHKREVELEKLKYQKEILELEIQKQNSQIKLLEEENKKYDNIINRS